MRTFVRAALLALGASAVSAQPEPKSALYTGGYWFDGTDFVQRDVYVRSDVFQTGSPGNGARTIDIGGRYVVPPFCEGHNHDIAAGKAEERNRRYLDAGVFYVNILNNESSAAQAQRAYWQRADTVDVSFANGGFTGIGGHPVEVLEGIKKGGGYPAGIQLADNAYYEVQSVSDVDAKWPLLMRTDPDVVKVFLQFSEDYEKRAADKDYYGNRGVSAAVFKRIASLAHSAGKRVVAHVTSAEDFHAAVQNGADIIAHVPGYMSIESISSDDARMAAAKGITVITTASLSQSYPVKGVSRDALKQKMIENLWVLKAAKVRLSVGSDTWGDTSHREVNYLRSLGVFNDLEILKMWTENCPTMIFPERKIGRLLPGYEASFLALESNPLRDFKATQKIALKVKNGRVIEQPSATH